MHRIMKQVAAALLLVPLFVVSGCSGGDTVYVAGLETGPAEAGTENIGTENIGTASGSPEAASSEAASSEAVSSEAVSGYVYVCGAVNHPGVYPMEPGMRVFEAITLAGGFSGEADEQWLNQAELLQDGQRLYVYTREETLQMVREGAALEQGSAGTDTAANPEDASGKININTADRETLMGLPGIGEAKADAVIQYRSEHGNFASIEEIQNISGIKSAVFSKIKDMITV